MKKKTSTQPKARSIGEGYDRRTGIRSWIFEVTDRNGKLGHVVSPFGSPKGHRTGLLEEIGRAGFPVPLRESDRNKLFQRLTVAPPAHRYQVVSTSGWTGDSFVTPRKVYAPRAHRLISTMGHSTHAQHFRSRGKLADWKREVAGPLRGNPLAMFGVAVAFASPLLEMLGVESGGFHLVGPSSIGKSTILAVAGSVWGGGGSIGFCDTWLSTSNALDDTANVHSDCFLALDETAVAGETPREAARLVLHAAYRLAGGQGKARRGDQTQKQGWRLQFLGSTEHSLGQLGSHAQETVAVGQSVRIIDVAADSGSGLGVWNALPKATASAAQFSDTLRAAAMRLYGTPADCYIGRLVADLQEDRAGRIDRLRKRMQVFLKKIGALQWQGAQARVARRFALVYAAGALAHEYGVLPWKRSAILSAVQQCHGRLISPEPPVTLKQSLDRVQGYIKRHKKAFLDLRKTKQKINKSQLAKAPGVILQKALGGSEYVFPTSIFRDKVCAGSDWQRIWDHLSAAGLTNEQKGGKRAVTRDFPDPIRRLRVVSVKPAILNHDQDESG